MARCLERAGRRKKLTEAAAHWARCLQQPQKTKDEIKADSDEQENWGLSKEAMDSAFAWANETGPARPAVYFELLPDGSFPVWTENTPTVAFFLSVRLCWVLRPLGGLQHMNWSQIHDVMAMKGYVRRRQAREHSRLELMQDAILEVMG